MFGKKEQILNFIDQVKNKNQHLNHCETGYKREREVDDHNHDCPTDPIDPFGYL